MMKSIVCLLFLSSGLIAQTRYIAHITPVDGNFKSTLHLHNQDAASASVTLKGYDADGIPYPDLLMTLAPGEFVARDVENLWNPGPTYVEVTGDEVVGVSVSYLAETAGASPAYAAATATTSKAWLLYPGYWDTVFDGLAVVNTDNEPARVLIEQLSSEGQVMARVLSDPILGKGKYLVLLGGGGGGVFTESPGAVYRIVSDKLVAVTALSGDADGSRFLWSNPAHPIVLEEPPPEVSK